MREYLTPQHGPHCPISSEDILLFYHRALDPKAYLRVAWHLRRCPVCRAQCATHASVSGVLATTIREPGRVAWRPPAMATPPQTGFWVVGSVLVIVITGSLYILQKEIYTLAPPASSEAIGNPQESDDCDPPSNKMSSSINAKKHKK
jgi:hypothetical protein